MHVRPVGAHVGKILGQHLDLSQNELDAVRTARHRVPPAVRVLVCDDADASREAWRDLVAAADLDDGPTLQKVGWVTTAARALDAISETEADVVLIDQFMPVTDEAGERKLTGPWLARAVLERFKERSGGGTVAAARCPGLALWTGNPLTRANVVHTRGFMRCGGDAVIDKADPRDRQVSLIRLVGDPVQRAKRTWDHQPRNERGVEVELTLQQERVAALVTRGLTTSEIATTLFLAETTVETHRKLIRRELGINQDRARDLVASVHRYGLPVEYSLDPGGDPFSLAR
jgi:DNA-binding NarL/FixJ family response regulator